MASEALVSPLARVGLFQGLRPMQMADMAHRAERIMFKPGAVIIEAGAAGDAAFVIVGGDAMRIAGPAESEGPELFPAGSLIGEMAMLIDTEHSSTVVAQTQVRALKISRQAMHEMMLEDPSLADHFVARISARLQGVMAELAAVERIVGGGEMAAFAPASQTAHEGHIGSH